MDMTHTGWVKCRAHFFHCMETFDDDNNPFIKILQQRLNELPQFNSQHSGAQYIALDLYVGLKAILGRAEQF